MLVAELMKFALKDVSKALGSEPTSALGLSGFTGVSTDSRNIRNGELFFALIGERFDGHDYLYKAITNGASGLVVSNGFTTDEVPVYQVNDTLKALGDLASFVRNKHDLICAAITGSNGKTTTKEMLSECVQYKYDTFKTQGNFNNLIGLPLSLFHLEEYHKAAVLELGMNQFGEIYRLAEICKPSIAVYTNVAPVHLEHLGTINDVAKAKHELIEKLRGDGIAVLNADDAILSKWADELDQTVITYGLENDADFKIESYEFDPNGVSKFKLNGIEYKIKFQGKHNIYNAACAIAGASAFGIKPDELVDVLARVKPFKQRSEIINQNGITIFNDCYNANPTSMRAAIDLLTEYPIEGKRIVVLGDMLELSKDEINYHIELGEYLTSKHIDALFATGDLGKYFTDKFTGNFSKYFNSKDDLAAELISYVKQGDGVLIKGSRRIALETVTEELMRNI